MTTKYTCWGSDCSPSCFFPCVCCIDIYSWIYIFCEKIIYQIVSIQLSNLQEGTSSANTSPPCILCCSWAHWVSSCKKPFWNFSTLCSCNCLKIETTQLFIPEIWLINFVPNLCQDFWQSAFISFGSKVHKSNLCGCCSACNTSVYIYVGRNYAVSGFLFGRSCTGYWVCSCQNSF